MLHCLASRQAVEELFPSTTRKAEWSSLMPKCFSVVETEFGGWSVVCHFTTVLSSHRGLLPGDVSWQNVSARPWVPSGEQKEIITYVKNMLFKKKNMLFL